MAKKEHVPETTGESPTKPNRELRRHPERLADAPISRDAADDVRRQQDVQDPRAKSTGHKKKTADKWNQ
jgi:hypothetical protein